MITDRNAMGITAEIANYLGRSAEGGFGEYDPLLAGQGIDEREKSLFIAEFGDGTAEY